MLHMCIYTNTILEIKVVHSKKKSPTTMKPINTLLLLLLAVAATSEAHDNTRILKSDPPSPPSTTTSLPPASRTRSTAAAPSPSPHPQKHPLSQRLHRLLWRQKAPPNHRWLHHHLHPLPRARSALPVDSDSMATFVKSIYDNISVIQISNYLTSPEAETLVSAPANST